MPDAVGLALYELAMAESKDFSLMYAPGTCPLPAGEVPLSILMETPSGFVSFITDSRGNNWLAWHVYAERRSGAKRVSPSEDVGKLACFCFLILYGPHFGSGDSRVCH